MSWTVEHRQSVNPSDNQDGRHRGSGIPRELDKKHCIWLANDPAFDEDDWLG
jgi:hypothetical protein